MAQQSYFDKFKQPETPPSGNYFDKFKTAETPPPAERGAWSKAMDLVQAVLSASGASGTRAMGQGLGIARRELSDPENLSTGAAALGGLAGGALGGPPGAIAGASVAGTLASKYGEGKDWGPAMQEGAGEGMFEAVGGPVSKTLGKYVFAPASRALTGAALRPDRAVLDALLDPATGKQFRTPGEAARFFRHEATGMMDRVDGSPGQSTFANGLIDIDEGARAQKVDILKGLEAQGATLSTDQLVPPNSFDAMVATLARRSGNAAEAGPAMEDAVRGSLARSHPVMPTPPGQRIPDFQPIPENMPWKPTDADQRTGGLGEALQDLFSARQKAEMIGNSARPKEAEQAMALTRSKMSEAIEGLDPRIAELNKQMRANIPITSAAINATMPIWGDAVPRVRVAGGMTRPNVQAFDYIRRGAGALARPAHVTGRALQSSAHRATSPQLMRVLQALLKGEQ